MFALVLNLCLISGECYQTVPETYNTASECFVEVVHQQAMGAPEGLFICVDIEE